MGHLPRGLSKGFYSTQRFGQSEESQRLKELLGLSLVGSEANGNHSAEWDPIFADLLVNPMASVRSVSLEMTPQSPQILLGLIAQAPFGSLVERTRTQSGISDFAD